MNKKIIRNLDERLDNLGRREILEIIIPNEEAEIIRGHIAKKRGYEIIKEFDDNRNNSKIYHAIKSLYKKNA